MEEEVELESVPCVVHQWFGTISSSLPTCQLALGDENSCSKACNRMQSSPMPEGTLRGILKHGTYWRRSVSVSESSDDSPSALPLDSDDSGLLFPAISLDSIQPKKTVSFNDHINHIIYRPNSSALARRRKNQKKAANKKKAAARRALSQCDSTDTSGVSSGSEASLEDVSQGFTPGKETTKGGEAIKA